MAKAIKQLKNQGARKISVACTHGVFAEGAIEKLQNAGCDEIICTDTIQNEFSKVKLASSLAKMIKT